MLLLAAVMTALSVSAGTPDDLAPPLLLASDGEALSRIVLPLEPSAGEQAAAGELQTYLRVISRATVPVVTSDQPGGGLRLLLGGAAAVRLGAELSPANLGPDGFILRSFGTDAIAIAGANDPSTLSAVYAFLEHLGCRWYMPGEIGEVIPRGRELVCAPLDRTEVPDFYHRVLWNNGHVAPTLTTQSQAEWADWYRKNRLGGLPADHGHAYHRWLPEDRYLPEHPEYFSLVRGDDGTTRREAGLQVCTSNPAVIEIAARAASDYLAANPTSLSFSLSPNDTGGFCECDACRALDGPGSDGLSDRILTFVNAVGEGVEREHPGRLLAYYALYGNLPGPPPGVRPRSNVMPVMVNTACHHHAIPDPSCPRNTQWRRDVAKWQRVSSQLFAYDYFQYSDLPTPVNRLVGPNIRYYRDTGCLGLSGEILGRSQVSNVALYIAARMLWDADQDPDALLDEFYRLYYRSAAEPMQAYFEALEGAARGQRSHALGASWQMYTPTLLAELQGHLDRARAEAQGGTVRERVEMAALDFRATALFVAAARARQHWFSDPGADTELAALEAIGAAEEFLRSIADRDIVAETILLGRLEQMRSAAPQPGAAGQAVVSPAQPEQDDEATFSHLWDQYDDLGALPEEGWLFHTDPDDQGERNGWHQPGFSDSRWTLIRIGEWWEPQRGAYDGVAWYRRWIETPEAAKGRQIFLWFGAVDESAWIYLDGALIGQHDEGEAGWDSSFRVGLPPTIGPGRHLLAVKVLDRTLNGGIWKPIKIVCPKAE